jgi:hypothetical protein
MIEIYCPKCLSFTPLVFDELYQRQSTQVAARNIVCPQCLSVLSILRGDGVGAYALQKIAELAYYALPTDPASTRLTQPMPTTKRSRKSNRLKLVP